MAAISKRSASGCAQQLENQKIGRVDLSDAQWSKLKSLLPPQKPKTGRPAINL